MTRGTNRRWAIEAGCDKLAVLQLATKPPPVVITPAAAAEGLRCPNGHPLISPEDQPEHVQTSIRDMSWCCDFTPAAKGVYQK